MISKKRWLVSGLLSLVAMVLTFSWCVAQEGKQAGPEAKKAAPAEEKKAEEKKEEPPKLPAYFSGANADPKKPDWPDPTGAKSGNWATPAGDGKGDKDLAKMSPEDLYDRIVHNLFSINMVWTLIAGFLVMFMQAGFALVEAGLCRAKNAGHTMSMNLMIYPLGCFAFWVYGFALGWGNWYNGPVGPGWYSTLGPGTAVLSSGIGIDAQKDDKGEPTGAYKYGLLGTKGFCLNGVDDVSVMALFFFMMVFMDTTATIPTGAMAERWSWRNFVIYGLWVALPYCIFANWVWGGGWLAQAGLNWNLGHGAVDFAGSGVVHAMGGFIGLAGAMVIGPRIGKYVDGKPQAIPGHHIPMVVAGTFILAFGWFGFNPGSTLAGTDGRIAIIAVNTMLASAAGAFGAYLWLKFRFGAPDVSMLCNGMLAGMVAITAPCAFVTAPASIFIGLVAGVLVIVSAMFIENTLKIDDPVGASSVHGVCGAWGILSVGLFADGRYGDGWNGVAGPVRGLLYGDASQLGASVIGILVCALWVGLMTYVSLKVIDLLVGNRVPTRDELGGLDVPEMGIEGYAVEMGTEP